jgi:hypothetical protein
MCHRANAQRIANRSANAPPVKADSFGSGPPSEEISSTSVALASG